MAQLCRPPIVRGCMAKPAQGHVHLCTNTPKVRSRHLGYGRRFVLDYPRCTIVKAAEKQVLTEVTVPKLSRACSSPLPPLGELYHAIDKLCYEWCCTVNLPYLWVSTRSTHAKYTCQLASVHLKLQGNPSCIVSSECIMCSHLARYTPVACLRNAMTKYAPALLQSTNADGTTIALASHFQPTLSILDARWWGIVQLLAMF